MYVSSGKSLFNSWARVSPNHDASFRPLCRWSSPPPADIGEDRTRKQGLNSSCYRGQHARPLDCAQGLCQVGPILRIEDSSYTKMRNREGWRQSGVPMSDEVFAGLRSPVQSKQTQ